MENFSQVLRTWRKARRLSQLDLALDADVSSRHISFLETGRARPSTDMISRLGDALALPLAARNQMLAGAGFAARYPARQWGTAEMAPIRAAVDHMLQNHAPYPALAVDRLWNVMRLNPPAQMLFAPLGLGEGGCMLDLMMSPLLPQVIENWPEVAHNTAQRLRTESSAQGGVTELDRVADHLTQGPPARTPDNGPVVPAIYRIGDTRLSLFSTIAQFGTPEDLTLDDLRIEMFFPNDSETEKTLRALAGEDTET